jgi:hypothetical protein
MATATISQLTAAAAAAPGDLFEMETVAGASRSITKQNLLGIAITGTGTLNTGTFTLTVAGNSVINGSFAGGMVGGFTLTLGANTAITGGGTLALGGFTLTVPATGTAALKTGAPTVGNVASWSNANTVQDAGAAITGGGTLALGGFTLTVPATGTAALKTGAPTVGNVASWSNANTVQDAGYLATDVARKTGTPTVGNMASWSNANTVQDAGFLASDVPRLSQINTFAFQVNAPAYMTTTVTINDSAFYSFVPFTTSGMIMLCCNNDATVGLFAIWRTGSAAYVTSISAGSNVNVVNTALTGTSGATGKVTVGCSSGTGMLYVENRRGASLIFKIMILA